jgi:hypothetical protein
MMNSNLEMEVFTYYREGTLQIICSQQADEHCERQQTDEYCDQQAHPHTSENNKAFTIQSDVSPQIGFTSEHDARQEISLTNDMEVSQELVWIAGESYEALYIHMREWDTS